MIKNYCSKFVFWLYLIYVYIFIPASAKYTNRYWFENLEVTLLCKKFEKQ